MIKIDQKAVVRKDAISVEFFYHSTKDKFRMKLVSNENGFQNLIKEQSLHRPGLALTGFVGLFSYARIQVFGNTEMRYLAQFPLQEKIEKLERIFKYEIPCIILTDNNEPFPEMIELANRHNITVLSSPFNTTKLTYLVGDFLDDQFSERVSIHGSLVDIYGVGILFIGKSGIGKSEVALDLIERGHRLVADDIVILTKKGEGILMGAGTNMAKHFMEIRGLGIIDIERMFGIRAIRYQKRLEIIVELEVWDNETEYTRTGLDESFTQIAGVEIPYVKLPIFPGKNITVISEVISLNYLLKHYGYDAAKVFQDRLTEKIRAKKHEDFRGVEYFERDYE